MMYFSSSQMPTTNALLSTVKSVVPTINSSIWLLVISRSNSAANTTIQTCIMFGLFESVTMITSAV